MANDMSSMMELLKGVLGDGAEEKVQAVVQALGNSSTNDESQVSDVIPTSGNSLATIVDSLGGGNMETMMQIKNIIDEFNNPKDPRANLLLSLKPYMRGSRQKSIDQVMKILSLTKLTGLAGIFNQGNKS